MGCIYNDFHGHCYFAEMNREKGRPFEEDPRGCSKGVCVVEDDPHPEDNCDDYESDGNEELE